MNFLNLASILGNFGATELLIVLVIVLLLFGARKLPDLARSLGKSMGEFKKGREEGAQATELKAEDKPAEKKENGKSKQAG